MHERIFGMLARFEGQFEGRGLMWFIWCCWTESSYSESRKAQLCKSSFFLR